MTYINNQNPNPAPEVKAGPQQTPAPKSDMEQIEDLFFNTINNTQPPQQNTQPAPSGGWYDDMFGSLNPIVGGGIDNSEKILEKAKDNHNNPAPNNNNSGKQNVSLDDISKNLDKIDNLLDQISQNV